VDVRDAGREAGAVSGGADRVVSFPAPSTTFELLLLFYYGHVPGSISRTNEVLARPERYW
jgi:hypothetical protein